MHAGRLLVIVGSALTVLVAATATIAGSWNGPTVCICDDGAEWPPYSYYLRVDGKPTDTIVGYSVDVIERIFTTAGIPYRLVLLPWKRCMAEVAEGNRYHMFLSGGRNPQRDRTYYVSDAYYHMHPGYLFSRRYHPEGLAITGREDLRKRRVCGINGYNYIVFGLDQNDIDTGSNNYQSLVKKLLNDRCDLSIDRLEILSGFKAIGKDFISHPDLVCQAIPGEPPEPFHMMFTKNPLGLELKRVVDVGIGELKTTGELDALLHKYDLPVNRMP